MFSTGLKIVNCIWGGFNGTNPRASTPQSAETAKIRNQKFAEQIYSEFGSFVVDAFDKYAMYARKMRTKTFLMSNGVFLY